MILKGFYCKIEIIVPIENNLPEMNRYFHISILSSLTFFISACFSTPSTVIPEESFNSAEIHVWNPPDEYELNKRRNRQDMLDDISRELDILNLKQQGLEQQTQTFDHNLKQSFLRAESLETAVQARIHFEKKQQELLKSTLDQLNLSQNILKSRFTTLEAMRSKPKKVFSRNDYTTAIKYLKDGKLKQSMHKFNVALHSNPPFSLKDNIHFGLASVLFKLRKYSEAIKHLEAIRKNHPKGDKWHKNNVSCRFQRMRKHIGTKLCIYNFRHSFATRLLAAGVDGLTVALLLGHADVSMLGKVYSHLSQDPDYLLTQLKRAG